jgi:hypothetical protein
MTRYWTKLTHHVAPVAPAMAQAAVCLSGSDRFAPESGQPEALRIISSRKLGNPEEGT